MSKERGRRDPFFARNFRGDFRHLLSVSMDVAGPIYLDNLVPVRVMFRSDNAPPSPLLEPNLQQLTKTHIAFMKDGITKVVSQIHDLVISDTDRKAVQAKIRHLTAVDTPEDPTLINVTTQLVAQPAQRVTEYYLKAIRGQSEIEAARQFIVAFDLQAGISVVQKRLLRAESFRTGSHFEETLKLLVATISNSVVYYLAGVDMSLADQSDTFLILREMAKRDSALLTDDSADKLLDAIVSEPASEAENHLYYPSIFSEGKKVFHDMYRGVKPIAQTLLQKAA